MEVPRSSDVFQTIKAVYGPKIRIAYEPNGGNLGDVLIAAGTICALDKSGLAWSMLGGRPIDHPGFDLLVYGGGGNLVPAYEGAARFLRAAAAHAKPIVILPHTIRGHLETLQSIRQGMVFCRDAPSAAFLAGRMSVPVFLADDMAFSLDFGMFGFWTIPALREALRAVAGPGQTLHAWRRDEEGQRHPRKPGQPGVDLSSVARTVGSEKSAILAQAASFLSAIGRFDRVWTDRLHIGIAASLLGLETTMVDNNYSKLHAVYELSIRDRFPQTRYFSSFDHLPAGQTGPGPVAAASPA